MTLTEMLTTIDARIGEVDTELENVAELIAERRRLKSARKALAKAVGGTAPRKATTAAAPQVGRQARPTTAARDREATILAFLKTPKTSKELGEQLGLSAACALWNLNRLLQTKKVQRIGGGATTQWAAT